MGIKNNYTQREDIIDALREEILPEQEEEFRRVRYIKEKNSVEILENVEMLNIIEEEQMALKEAEEHLATAKLSEEELFAKLLKQKRDECL